MRLTTVFRVSFPFVKKPRGLRYEGINRRTKPLKTSYKYDAVNDMMMEEQNMKYLSNPYLTGAQEELYGREHERKLQRYRNFIAQKRKPFRPDRTLEEHFRSTTGLTKKWE